MNEKEIHKKSLDEDWTTSCSLVLNFVSLCGENEFNHEVHKGNHKRELYEGRRNI